MSENTGKPKGHGSHKQDFLTGPNILSLYIESFVQPQHEPRPKVLVSSVPAL